MHTLIGRQDGSKLPNVSCPDEVTDAFRKYFDGNIQIIHENMDKARANISETVANDDPPSTHYLRLSSFEAASEAEVLGVINKFPAKSCGLDPIPTQLIKSVVNCQIRGTRVPQKAIVPVGRPRPYSIITLNMRFIPKASLRASSQITASSYILERHL